MTRFKIFYEVNEEDIFETKIIEVTSNKHGCGDGWHLAVTMAIALEHVGLRFVGIKIE